VATDNALSQAQIATLHAIVSGAKTGSDTPLQSAQKLVAQPPILAVVLEDGLEFSGLGVYGGARALAKAVVAHLTTA
jgi:hypothetical protein